MSSPYINITQASFDAGGVPPASLDEAVELQALELHGLDTTQQNLDSYRVASRQLSLDARSEIFFLRANDRLFRPCVQLINQPLRGHVLEIHAHGSQHLEPISLEMELSTLPAALLVASTSS